ncbi:MAG: bifunctional precorrin-2 dehydrogenase/sirohydrochlorin ferrochelatase [Candidatus Omnitrophota bacterium]
MRELYYPIALKLKDKTALVAGGGEVAQRKVKTLLKFGARVGVVSPDLTTELSRLFDSRRISWRSRVIRRQDVKVADIIIAATSEPAVNKKISQWAKEQNILVNIVDNAGLSTFISPAVFSNGKATVAVYTQGKNPVLSRDLKNFLKEHWDEFLSYRSRL